MKKGSMDFLLKTQNLGITLHSFCLNSSPSATPKNALHSLEEKLELRFVKFSLIKSTYLHL